MGKRDIRGKEPKKPKKDSRKATAADILPSSVTVEVIKKGKKDRFAEE